MESLDDIWDAPVEPQQRPPSSLFLPSDDENDPGDHPAASTNADIDALFADLDKTVLSYQPALDLDALRREADARHAKTILTPRAVLPSSSPEKNADDNQGDSEKGKKKNAGEKKERKRAPPLDEGRLLGPDGFPLLIQNTKNFKPKGKGHEVEDLNRLLQVYQFWTHKLYPKTQFKDTVERVEKICHSRRMHVSLSVWRDEAHGLVNGVRPDDHDKEQPIDLTSPTHSRSHSRAPSPQAQQATSRSSPSSRPPTNPPTSGSERTSPDPDSFDVDAFIRDANARLASAPKSINPGAQGARQNGIMDVDEDEAMWNELDEIAAPAPQPQQAAQAPQRTTRPTSFAASLDEDEDMWDVVREMEIETGKTAKGPQQEQNTAPAASATNAAGGPAEDDDWEDMYL